MNELTKTNQNLTKKEALGQYVHDMVDLEIRAFSLRKMTEDAREEVMGINQHIVQETNRINKEKEDVYKKYDSVTNKMAHRSLGGELAQVMYDWWLDSWGAIFLVLPLIVWGIFIIIRSFQGTVDEVIFPTLLGLIALYLLQIFIAVPVAKVRLNDDSSVRYYTKKCREIEEKYLDLQKYIETQEKYAATLLAYADGIDGEVVKIETALQKNYALNIIPPDYRRLECLVWIDYAFRNDQVDTMREATLQCDKWVRHNDTMKALKELAENIRSVAVLLENMDSNISMMNQDLFRIAEAQEQQLSESQSARYAMESVQKSTERLAMYEDMKRAGTF